MFKVFKASLFLAGIAVGMTVSMQGLRTLATTPELEENMPFVSATLNAVGLSALPEQAAEFMQVSGDEEDEPITAIDGIFAGMQGAAVVASTAVSDALFPEKPTQINRLSGQSSTRVTGGAKFVSID